MSELIIPGFSWVPYIKNFETADERRSTQIDAVCAWDEKLYGWGFEHVSNSEELRSQELE